MQRRRACPLALALCQLLATLPVLAQQAGSDALDKVAPDVPLRADFQGSGDFTLAELHRIAQRVGVDFYAFWVRSTAMPAVTGSDDSGEWRGQSDADWERTMCRLRVNAARYHQVDVTASTLYVERLWLAGTAATVREFRRLAGAARLTEVRPFEDEEYQHLRRNFTRPQETPEYRFPEDFLRLPGCEAGVQRIKGWRMADLDRNRTRSPREILRDIAAGDPGQPIEMRLDLASTATVREVANLATTYDIARLWLRGMHADTRQRPVTVVEVYELIFSSAAPSHQEQLDRGECRMRGKLRLEDQSQLLVDLRAEFTRSATVYLRAADAAQLLDKPPAWLVAVKGLEFGRPGSLEVLKADFARLFLEPVRFADASHLTERCQRYAAER